ncbi:MAG: hypothetical protein GC159_21730 [Phycisphaera sp.]|nr:hypothetical protein [Phycisphaera sp.]
MTSNLTRIAFIVCLTAGASFAAVDNPTFNRDVAPIIFDKCTGCHRPDQAAPFSLITYDDVSRRSRTISRVLDRGYMPPWKPVPGHGDFVGDRRLSEQQAATLKAWIANGKPEGNPADKPTPPTFKSGWALGEPDLVLKMDKGFNVPADGPDIYRWFVLPLKLPEDKWVKAIEFRPSARSVVHHSLFFLDSSGQARKLDAQDPVAGFSGMRANISGRLGGYVPGMTASYLPEDLARALPAGSDIVLQTHFHPTGKAEVEQSELALYFADKAPSRPLVTVQIPPVFGRMAGIDIPAGDKAWELKDEFTVPCDVVAWEVTGHAHYLCKSMKLDAKLPDGSITPLLYIDNWSLDWQDTYQFKTPVKLPKGTVITTHLIYDNSADNPQNPNSPPKRVKWGIESTDEMGSMSVIVTPAHPADADLLETAYRMKIATTVRGGAKQLAMRVLERLDRNGDGQITRDELPQRYSSAFDRFDANHDGVIDKQEFESNLTLLGRGRQR